jgi:hypothetical protein
MKKAKGPETLKTVRFEVKNGWSGRYQTNLGALFYLGESQTDRRIFWICNVKHSIERDYPLVSRLQRGERGRLKPVAMSCVTGFLCHEVVLGIFLLPGGQVIKGGA